MHSYKHKTNKFVAVVMGLMLSVSLLGAQTVSAAALSQTQIDAIIGLLTSFGADSGTISNVRTSLTGGTPSSTTSSTASAATGGYTFTRNLKQGDTGTDVMNLQKVLNMSADTQVSVSGAGSPGNETSTYGPATAKAVSKFQEKYASEILTPVGLSKGTGTVGPSTRAKLNVMGGGATTTTTTTTTTGTTVTTVTPMGSGLTVTLAAQQPSAQLAPLKAARVPFTNVTFTASNDGDVTVNSLVVERAGQSVDAALDSVILLDENGSQVGLSKTLNSQHQATLTQSFVVKAGQSRTMVLAGNRPSSGTAAHAGMVVAISLKQVNTSSTVNGSFPITGTAQTINEGLTIGSVTVAKGSLDPGTSITKEVGISAYTFSSVRVTAGSGEDVRLRSVRWNQTESASQSDLANIKVYVDGTAYDPVVTDGGQYYTATFGTGIVLPKGFSKEVSIKGDVIGGSGRKIDFDIAKRTDIDLVGELYGYGIMPDVGSGTNTTLDDSQVTTADDYYFDASVLTIDVGSLNVSTSNASPSTNIAVNTANQPLGSFVATVNGEAITVGRLAFNISLAGEGSGDDVDDITNITLVDQNGAVLAGPVDGDDDDSSYTTGTGEGSVVFTDTVTFPVGKTTFFLKGKIGTAIDNSTTVTASTTPSADFATVRGLTTGKTITPTPASVLTFSTMTVKSGSLSISPSTQPPARTIIAGGTDIEFARYTFDATASGEDIRVTTVPLYYSTNGTRTDLTNCQLYDGATSLTTGSNVKKPATTDTASTTSFTFDGNGLIVTKGTAKTLSLHCDLTSGTTNKYWWGLDSAQGLTSYSGATGLASSETLTGVVFAEVNGNVMTASAGGSYTVALDSAPAYNYRAIKAGTADVPLAAFKFTADTVEDLMLQRIAFQLGNTASSSPSDLVNETVTIWNGSEQVGSARFDGPNGTYPDFATSTLTKAVKIPRGGDVTLVVKGSLVGHDSDTNTTLSAGGVYSSTSGNGAYGAFLAVSYDGNNNGINGNYAIGGGGNVSGTSGDVTTNGIRIFRNVPTITIKASGSRPLVTGGDLYKFSVTNPDSRDMVFNKMSFGIGTSGVAALRVTDFILYGGGVAGNTATSSVDRETAGVDLDVVEIIFGANEARKIPAGQSKEYILRATLSSTGTGTDSLNVRLLNDTSYPALPGLMGTATSTNPDLNSTLIGYASSTNNIIWTPFSTSSPTTATSVEGALDWTNGYGIPIIDVDGTRVDPTGSLQLQSFTITR